jgi:hypothetical protein
MACVCVHILVFLGNNLDPYPHQRDQLDPDPHQFADDKPKCIFEHFFKVWSLYLEARIRIRIRIKATKEDPDPHQSYVDPQH